MNTETTQFKLHNETDLDDNDEYPSELRMLADIALARQEYGASERGEIELRTSYLDIPDMPKVISVQPESSFASTARESAHKVGWLRNACPGIVGNA